MSAEPGLKTIPDEVPLPLIHPRLAFYASHRPEFRPRRHKVVLSRLESPAAEAETLDGLRMDPPDAVAAFLQSEVLLALSCGQAASPLLRAESFAARALFFDKNPVFEEFVRDAEAAADVNGTVDCASLDGLLQGFYDASHTPATVPSE